MSILKGGLGEDPLEVKQIHSPVHRVLLSQLVATGLIAIMAGVYYPSAMKSVVYGCLVSLLPGAYLWWRLRQKPIRGAGVVVREAYQMALTRMLIVIVLLSLPLWHRLGFLYGGVLTGFAWGQLIWLAGWAWVQSGRQK